MFCSCKLRGSNLAKRCPFILYALISIIALIESVVAALKSVADKLPFPAIPRATAFTLSTVSTAPITLLFFFAQLGPSSNNLSSAFALNHKSHSFGTEFEFSFHSLYKSFMKVALAPERKLWSELWSFMVLILLKCNMPKIQ